MEASFSSSHVPNGLKLRTEDIDVAGRPQEIPIADFYEISRIAAAIVEHKALFVALQFPEVLLPDAANVVWELEDLLLNEEVTLFVLGDTSYGEASVDGIAAGHMPTDFIVHFGTSTLDVSDGPIPVLNIYGERPINVQECSDLILKETKDKLLHKIILVYDSMYTSGAKRVCDELLKRRVEVRLGLAVPPNQTTASVEGGEAEVEVEKHSMMIGGLEVSFTDIYDGTEEFYTSMLEQHLVCFIGKDGWLLSAVLMRCEGAVCLVCNPNGNGPNSPTLLPAPEVATSLRKRYYLVQKVAEAKVIGILVGTMGVSNFHEVVDRMVSLISSTGRKPYIFAVGNPNVAKLSNFAEVNAFCIVASAEASLLNQRDFAIPVVTPYELEVALGVRPWDMYSTHFGELLQTPLPLENREEADETPAFSLISSELVDKRRKGVQLAFEDESATESEIGSSVSSRSLTTYHSPATEFLCQRSYQGLERRLGEDQPHLATEGRGGIASDYQEVSKLEKETKSATASTPASSSTSASVPVVPKSSVSKPQIKKPVISESVEEDMEDAIRDNAVDFLNVFEDSDGDE